MRLIDADPIMQRLTYNNGTPTVDNYRDGAPVLLEIREIKDLIRNAPTVSPWIKTAERLPTEADAGYDDEIITLYQDGETKMLGFDYWKYVAKFPEQYLYWMPIPPLPEVRHDNS